MKSGSFAAAVVGQPNAGKTTIVSTLALCDTAPIEALPGTTPICLPFEIRFGDETVLTIWDTPGFERPERMFEWLQQRPGQSPKEVVGAFLTENESNQDFKAEREILKPVAKGAVIIYVVDSTKGIRDDDRQEMQIIRALGRPTLAVLNDKTAETSSLELKEWRRELNDFGFSSQFRFNPHTASFSDRMKLLEKLSQCMDDSSRRKLSHMIQAWRTDWKGKADSTARDILGLLKTTLAPREPVTLGPNDERESAAENLRQKVQDKLREAEGEFREKVRERFTHSNDPWKVPRIPSVEDDLFGEATWRVLGLNKWQLIVSATGGGAAIGGSIDAGVGGSSFLTGTAIGAAVGAAGGYYAAKYGSEKAVSVNLRDFLPGKWKWLPFTNRPLTKTELNIEIASNGNLPWVLLDRALIYSQAAIHRSHGDRSAVPEADAAGGADEKQGPSHRWKEHRKCLERLIKEFAKGNPGENSDHEVAKNVLVKELTIMRAHIKL
jgi:predicted GTPase